MKIKQKIQPFELYSDQYDAWFIKYPIVYQSELRAVQEQLPPKGKGIEIGMGSGRFSEPLGINIGIEPSRKMAKIAARRDLKVIQGIAEYLPICNSQFDFVLLVTTICFLDDVIQSLREIYRILRHGGCIIVGFVDSESAIGKTYQKERMKSRFYQVARFFNVEEVLAHLNGIGFVNFNINQTLYSSLNQIKLVESVKPGYGQGAFVVVKGFKLPEQEKI